jgi:hypothetical protein
MKDTPMILKERVRLFEEDSKILEKIAKQYDEGSKEYSAVRHAAIALWYALTEGTRDSENTLPNLKAISRGNREPV